MTTAAAPDVNELIGRLAGALGSFEDTRKTATAAVETATQAANRINGIETKLDATQKALEEATRSLAAVQKSQRSASFSLPGAEEEVRNGKVRFGHFVAAEAVRAAQGDSEARKRFPMVYDIDEETRKRLTTDGEKRVLTTTIDSGAGFLVPEEISNPIVEFAYPMTCLSKLGITRVTNAKGEPYRIRKMSGSGTAYMVGQTVAPTESAITFGRANLYMRKIAALGSVSRELDQLSNPSAIAALEADFQGKIALKYEQQVAEGIGGSYEMRGLSQYTNALDGINTLDATGTDNGSVTAQANGRDLRDHWMKRIRQIAEEANGAKSGGGFGYLMNTKLKNILSQQLVLPAATTQKADTGAVPMFGPGIVTDAQLEALYGPIAHSTQFAANLTVGGSSDGARVIGGYWGNTWTVEWGGLIVKQSDTAIINTSASNISLNAFTQEAVILMVVMAADFAAVRPSDLVLATGFRTVRTET